jgi:uncharacterized protein
MVNYNTIFRFCQRHQMNVEIQHYSFKAWKAQWSSVPTDWWRIVLAVLAFLAGLVAIAALGHFAIIPLIKSTFPDISPLAKELVQFGVIGLQFVSGLMAFLFVKRLLHKQAPSVLASSAASFRGIDAVVSGALFLILALISAVVVDGVQPITDRIAEYPLSAWISLVLIALIAVGIQASTEEVVFRGYLLPVLASRMRVVTAVVIATVVFTVGHPQSGLYGTIGVALFSMLFSISILRAGSISFAMGAHVTNNMAMMLLFPEMSNADARLVDVVSLAASLMIWLAYVEYVVRKRRSE